MAPHLPVGQKEGKVCYDLKSMDSFQTRFVGYIFEHLLDV